MAHGRWYPTLTNLGDGTLMTFSGLDENGNTNTTVEIYSAGTGWGTPIGSPFTPPLYPRMHLLPSGKVFYSGSTAQSRLFDLAAQMWSGVIATTNYGGTKKNLANSKPPLRAESTHEINMRVTKHLKPVFGMSKLVDITADKIELYLRCCLRQRIQIKTALGYREGSVLQCRWRRRRVGDPVASTGRLAHLQKVFADEAADEKRGS